MSIVKLTIMRIHPWEIVYPTMMLMIHFIQVASKEGIPMVIAPLFRGDLIDSGIHMSCR